MSQARQATDPATLRAALGGVPLFRDLAATTTSTARRAASGRVATGGARSSSTRATRATRCTSCSAGRVKISSPSDTGVEAILATLRPGEFFGALALLDGAPRSASATAVDATETLILPREQLPPARQRRARDPRPRVRGAGPRAAPAHQPRRGAPLPRHRRAPRGAAGADGRRAGPGGDDGEIRLDGPITQGELAAMVGSTRQSVNKLLGLVRRRRADPHGPRLDRDRRPARAAAGRPPLGRRRRRPPSAPSAPGVSRSTASRTAAPAMAARSAPSAPAQEHEPPLGVPAGRA